MGQGERQWEADTPSSTKRRISISITDAPRLVVHTFAVSLPAPVQGARGEWALTIASPLPSSCHRRVDRSDRPPRRGLLFILNSKAKQALFSSPAVISPLPCSYDNAAVVTPSGAELLHLLCSPLGACRCGANCNPPIPSLLASASLGCPLR